MDKAGFVYFIETSDSAFIKIGFTTAIHRRMAEVAVLLPGLKELGCVPDDGPLEASLHHRFKRHRERGEWFRDSAEIREYIAISCIPIPQKPVVVSPSDPPKPRPKGTRKYTISKAVLEQRRKAARRPRTATPELLARMERTRAKRWPRREAARS